jgi:hypothetical protein
MAKQPQNTRLSAATSSSTSPAPKPKRSFSDPINMAIMVGTIVAATAAVGGLAYAIGKDVGQGELKMRTDLSAMNLPQIAEDTRASTADLKIASAAFKDMLVNNATYQDMLAKHEAQLGQIKELTSTVERFTARDKAQQDQIKTLEARLAVHENPDRVYNLEKGKSQQVAGGEVIVGMHYYLAGFAEITINDNRESAQAGKVYDVRGLKGGNCRVKIISVSPDNTASFSAECTK